MPNFSDTLSEAAATYFDTYDWTEDFYGAPYPLLAFQLCHRRFGPSYGTAEHMQEISEKAITAPCFRKAGSAVKPGRHFDLWNHSAGEDDYNGAQKTYEYSLMGDQKSDVCKQTGAQETHEYSLMGDQKSDVDKQSGAQNTPRVQPDGSSEK